VPPVQDIPQDELVGISQYEDAGHGVTDEQVGPSDSHPPFINKFTGVNCASVSNIYVAMRNKKSIVEFVFAFCFFPKKD
jgi:hypothetical protein